VLLNARPPFSEKQRRHNALPLPSTHPLFHRYDVTPGIEVSGLEGTFEVDGPCLIWLKPREMFHGLLNGVTLLAEMLILERIRLGDEQGLVNGKPKFLRAAKIFEIRGFCETVFHFLRQVVLFYAQAENKSFGGSG